LSERLRNETLISAGAYHSGGPFHLHRWLGGAAQPERLKVKGFGDYHPEAIVIYPQKGLPEVQFLSDDGKRQSDGTRMHDLPDRSR
jgi:hypothetical protein